MGASHVLHTPLVSCYNKRHSHLLNKNKRTHYTAFLYSQHVLRPKPHALCVLDNFNFMFTGNPSNRVPYKGLYGIMVVRLGPKFWENNRGKVAFAPGWNSPKSAEISQTHKERNTQDFRAVYFNLFLVILPKFGSLFYTTIIPYKPLYCTPLLGFPVCIHKLWINAPRTADYYGGTPSLLKWMA